MAFITTKYKIKMSHNVLTNVTDLIGDLNRHKEKSIQQKTKKKKKGEWPKA